MKYQLLLLKYTHSQVHAAGLPSQAAMVQGANVHCIDYY